MEQNGRFRKLHYIYVLLDFLAAFVVTIISLLSYYGYSDFASNIVSNLIFAGGVAIAMVDAFLVFKVF